MTELQEILLNIIYVALTIGIPAVCGVLINWLLSKKSVITEYNASSFKDRIINEGIDAICKAVDVVNQTYVDSLKESGKFSKDAQAIAMDKTVLAAKQLMTIECREALDELYNNSEDFIRNMAENIIKSSKVDTSVSGELLETTVDSMEEIKSQMFDYINDVFMRLTDAEEEDSEYNPDDDLEEIED